VRRSGQRRIAVENLCVKGQATQSEPGSPEKVEILRLRWSRGEALFHPNDRRIEWELCTIKCESVSLNGIFDALHERERRYDE
jgi:hypothetical protein